VKYPHDFSKLDVCPVPQQATLEPAANAEPAVTGASPVGHKPKYYPALDGLRGVAILAVFFSHFGGGHTISNPVIHVWSMIADAGWMGVDLFFCLSGFLITGILLDTSQAEHRIKNFYARRALRIFPLFYASLLVLLLLTPILHLHWQAGHLLYPLYLGNMVPLLAPTLRAPGPQVGVTHLWSLAVEEQFYMLWPFVVWFVPERKKLLRLSVGIVIAVLLLRVGLVARGASPFIIYSLLFTRADSLICGAILALLVRGPGGRQLPVHWVLPVSAVAIVALFVRTGSSLHDAPLISSVGYSVIAIFSACLVYCAWLGEHWIARIANHKVLRFFGRYSYGLYIYHGFLIVLFLPLVIPFRNVLHSAWLGGIAFMVCALGTTIVLAVLSYHFFEAPLLRLKKRFA
jgi:peptidoglycan/LPS O-acetylase OafA/YrhL